MYIEQLQIKNYRNYIKADLNFTKQVNLIVGENAQGKTNLMEAIYVLALTRSYRTSRERELIRWGEDFARIKGIISKKERKFPLEIIITNQGKKAKINHLEQERLSSYIGTFNIVMFAPEDLTLVKGSPQIRRRFIDVELGQIQPSYIYHLMQYQRIIKQRNHLLKQIQTRQTTDQTMLDILTEQLVEHAATILHRRFIFLEKLRTWAKEIHFKISRSKETLHIAYQSTIDVSEDALLEKISNEYLTKFHEIRQNEIERGLTLIGPHRDDLIFYINDKNVQQFGSQGQQRTTALSVKLAEIQLIYEEVGSYPVLLLDDVLSELDHHRQSHLLNTIQGKVQTFVSTTSVADIHRDTLKHAQLYEVIAGKIK